ncbi:MAG: MEDS domain-containing protein [Mycobacterium sp.]
MRPHGELASAAGLIPLGHVAWGYRNRAEFLARAAEYIADGLALNQRILYASDGDRDVLVGELVEMGFADAVRAGQIAVTPVAEHYRFVAGSDVVDPEATVADGVAGMEYVVARGSSGCRAVVDGAVLARTPEQRAAFSRLEYLIDQKMAALPLSALCAYNLEILGESAKELMCLHPFVGQGAVGFRIYAEGGVDFALAGEIDAASNGAFIAALQRVWPLIQADEPVIDAYGLDFITHRELCAIDQLGGADRRHVVLRTDRRALVRLVHLLELENVRVQTSPRLLAGTG